MLMFVFKKFLVKDTHSSVAFHLVRMEFAQQTLLKILFNLEKFVSDSSQHSTGKQMAI